MGQYYVIFCFLDQRISDFLNSFDMSCRSRLSNLNEKLTEIERKVDYLEAKVARSGETPAQSKKSCCFPCALVSLRLQFITSQIYSRETAAKDISCSARPRLLIRGAGDEQVLKIGRNSMYYKLLLGSEFKTKNTQKYLPNYIIDGTILRNTNQKKKTLFAISYKTL